MVIGMVNDRSVSELSLSLKSNAVSEYQTVSPL